MTATTSTTRGAEQAAPVRKGDFRHRVACRSADPEVFFPVAAVGPLHDARVRAATAICDGCPVREECLTWALSALPEGIAGGMTAEERRTERSRRARARRRATTSTTSKGEGAPAATGAPSQVSHNNALDRTRVMEGHRS